MADPTAPDAEMREQLLDVLAELVARGGPDRLLLPPVAPGPATFPEPWAPTRAGVALLLRRLLWHAGIEREVEVDGRRAAAAPPTERKPATRVELVEVRRPAKPGSADAEAAAVFVLGFIGNDDVVGTLAHEVGAIHAICTRPEQAEPYRTADPPTLAFDAELDAERGSIATVYLGLGVLAANAAFQQYQRGGRFNGGYEPLEYDVLRAGAVPMSALAFLLAVQCIVRGDIAAPVGLGPPQRDEVSAWIAALGGERAALRERLGIPVELAPAARPAAVAFEGVELEDEPAPARNAFRWRTNRGGIGLVAGTVLGVGVALAVSRGTMPWLALGGATGGHVIGRRVRVPRCSACATIVREGATSCRSCGAALLGDIDHLSERLEAEERLDQAGDAGAGPEDAGSPRPPA